MRAPLIGITSGAGAEAPGFYLLRWDYPHALSEVGVIPVVLTPGKASECPTYLDNFAGLVISGGGDVDSAHYGVPGHPGLRDVHPERDRFEMNLAQRALARGMPILGICRGMQLLNVVFGGSLIPDLEERFGKEELLEHDDEKRPRDVLAHSIRIREGSRLRESVGQSEFMVNSFHHQAVDRLGEDLEAVAWSDDGLIEAFEGSGDAYLLGVQWHPESLWRLGSPYLSIFEDLREAALTYASFWASLPESPDSGEFQGNHWVVSPVSNPSANSASSAEP